MGDDDIQIGGLNDNQSVGSKTGASSSSQGNVSPKSGGQQQNNGTSSIVPSLKVAQPTSAFNLTLEEAAAQQAQTMAAPPEKFLIPTQLKEKFPDLIQLIIETESMNDEERQYWFQILPIMSEEQIARLKNILTNEKQQLTKLDKEYETELTKLNEKHMLEWKEFEMKEKKKAMTSAESKVQAQEQAEEEDLLKRLSQL